MTILQGGIPIAGFISPTDIIDLYPTHRDEYGYGGHRTVATLTKRDEISMLRRVLGMTCYVEDVNTYYVLYNGIANTDWKPVFNFFNGDLQLDINLPENYILLGDINGKAVPSPAFLDLRADLMLTRQADFIIGHPSPKLPNAQVLSTMADGLLYSTGGVISTTPTGGGGSGLNINLVGEVTGNGVVGGVVPTILQLTLDQIKKAVATVDLNEQKIQNLNSVVTQVEDAINYEFIQGLIAGTLPSHAVARVGYIVADLEIDAQIQRIIFGTQPIPEALGGLRLDNARVWTATIPTETILAWGNKDLSGYRFNHVTDITGGIGILKLQSFINETITDIFQIVSNNVNLLQHRVVNAADPIDDQDYTTKAWVIANSGGGGGVTSLTGVVTGTSVSGVINTSLASDITFSGATQLFQFNNQVSEVQLKNNFIPTSGNQASTALRFYNTNNDTSFLFQSSTDVLADSILFELLVKTPSVAPISIFDIFYKTVGIDVGWTFEVNELASFAKKTIFFGDTVVQAPLTNASATNKQYVDDAIGAITIAGAVYGTTTGNIIGTTLNSVIAASAATQTLNFNSLNSDVIFYNGVEPATGQTATTSLYFTAIDGRGIKLRYNNPENQFSNFSISAFEDPSLTPFVITEWLHTGTVSGYTTLFHSGVKINAETRADVAGLSVIGGSVDINDTTICIKAEGQTTNTRIAIQNSKPSNAGQTYTLNSNSDGVFTLRSEEADTDYLTIDEFGSLVVNASAFYILRKANVNKVMQSSTAPTTITSAGTYAIIANGNGVNLTASNQFFDYDPTFTNRVIYRGLYFGDADVTITIRSYSTITAGTNRIKSFRLYKNGVASSITFRSTNSTDNTANGADTVTINMIINLAPNDYIDVYGTVTGTGISGITLTVTDISTKIFLI